MAPKRKDPTRPEIVSKGRTADAEREELGFADEDGGGEHFDDTEEQFQKHFDEVDQNKDGVLDWKELHVRLSMSMFQKVRVNLVGALGSCVPDSLFGLCQTLGQKPRTKRQEGGGYRARSPGRKQGREDQS